MRRWTINLCPKCGGRLGHVPGSNQFGHQHVEGWVNAVEVEVVALSEIRVALRSKEAKAVALEAFNSAPSTGFVRSFNHALEAVVEHAFPSIDSERGEPK
ncbi:MAG TPA: hypothetical protein VD761_11870 [Solirubrobacterales bacterium]|nr:hypothetical protein [Solirubrobacterales bacterium]